MFIIWNLLFNLFSIDNIYSSIAYFEFFIRPHGATMSQLGTNTGHRDSLKHHNSCAVKDILSKTCQSILAFSVFFLKFFVILMMVDHLTSLRGHHPELASAGRLGLSVGLSFSFSKTALFFYKYRCSDDSLRKGHQHQAHHHLIIEDRNNII